MAKRTKADIVVSGDGPWTTVYLFTPRTARGRRALRDNVDAEPWQWLGPSLGVGHRYAEDLAAALAGEGLVVR